MNTLFTQQQLFLSSLATFILLGLTFSSSSVLFGADTIQSSNVDTRNFFSTGNEINKTTLTANHPVHRIQVNTSQQDVIQKPKQFGVTRE